MAAEQNLIKSEDMARVREIDFTFRFGEQIKSLQDILGITRAIQKTSGTTLKAYKATGTLESGEVPEGEIIPLSHYKTVPVTFEEIEIKKWRKATSIEAISDGGFDQAVNKTNNKMLKDIVSGIRKRFFTFLSTGTGVATGVGFQATLAQAWGQLQVLFEDEAVEAVYFLNPLDVADYLGNANISTQTVFGMKYIEDFLGLGDVFLTSNVPKGKVYATAKENIVLYYVNAQDSDLARAFTFTTDANGLIGIHESNDYDNLTNKNTVISGITLFAERLDGIVVGTIGAIGGQSVGPLSVGFTQKSDNGPHHYTENELEKLKKEDINNLAKELGYEVGEGTKAEMINKFLEQQGE